MREMVYQDNNKIREVLDSGFCFGLMYYILNLGTHPTAYVMIPSEHWLYNVESYEDLPIECHGGVTYWEDYLIVGKGSDMEINGRFLGWDYRTLL